MTTDRTSSARALGASMGWPGASTSSTTSGRPVTTTVADPDRGLSRANSMSRNRDSSSVPPAIRWPRTMRRPASTT